MCVNKPNVYMPKGFREATAVDSILQLAVESSGFQK